MTEHRDSFRFLLPAGWSERVEPAMLHVISLAQHAMAYTRNCAVQQPSCACAVESGE